MGNDTPYVAILWCVSKSEVWGKRGEKEEKEVQRGAGKSVESRKDLTRDGAGVGDGGGLSCAPTVCQALCGHRRHGQSPDQTVLPRGSSKLEFEANQRPANGSCGFDGC